MRPIPLDLFDAQLTREHLDLHGVSDAGLISQTYAITGGHPLTLSLAATLLKKEGPAALTDVRDPPTRRAAPRCYATWACC